MYKKNTEEVMIQTIIWDKIDREENHWRYPDSVYKIAR